MSEPSTPAPSPSAQRAIARRDAEERAARQQRLRTVAIVAAAAVVVAGGIAIVEAVRPHARDAAVAYLDAIAAGDVAAANALAPEPGAVDGELPLEGSMDGATPITDVRVADEGEALTREGDDGERIDVQRFAAGFAVGGEQQEAQIEVERTGGWWVAEQWQVTTTLAQRVPVFPTIIGPSDVRIGAITIDASLAIADRWLYPGSYEAVSEDGEQWIGVATPFDVGDGGTWVRPEVAPTDAVLDELTATALESLAECIDRADDVLDCTIPDAVPDAPAGTPVAWRLEDEPSAEPIDGAPWSLAISATVVASYADAAGTTVEQRFTVPGRASVVSIVDDDLAISVLWDAPTG